MYKLGIVMYLSTKKKKINKDKKTTTMHRNASA